LFAGIEQRRTLTLVALIEGAIVVILDLAMVDGFGICYLKQRIWHLKVLARTSGYVLWYVE
jgi:hypothetical protein